MSQTLSAALGIWKGTNQLNLGGEGDNLHVSDSTLTFDRAALDQFLSVTYTWAFNGEPHQGTLLFGTAEEVAACWVDSFHTGGSIMQFKGDWASPTHVRFTGSYPAGDGSPDWHWRIELFSRGDELGIEMTNITPSFEEEWAVRATYHPA